LLGSFYLILVICSLVSHVAVRIESKSLENLKMKERTITLVSSKRISKSMLNLSMNFNFKSYLII